MWCIMTEIPRKMRHELLKGRVIVPLHGKRMRSHDALMKFWRQFKIESRTGVMPTRDDVAIVHGNGLKRTEGNGAAFARMLFDEGEILTCNALVALGKMAHQYDVHTTDGQGRDLQINLTTLPPNEKVALLTRIREIQQGKEESFCFNVGSQDGDTVFLPVDSKDGMIQELGEIGATLSTLLEGLRDLDQRIFPLIRNILDGEATINDPDKGIWLTTVMVDETVAEIPMRDGEISYTAYHRMLENGIDLRGFPIVGDLSAQEQYTFLKIAGERINGEARKRVYDMTQVEAKAT